MMAAQAARREAPRELLVILHSAIIPPADCESECERESELLTSTSTTGKGALKQHGRTTYASKWLPTSTSTAAQQVWRLPLILRLVVQGTNPPGPSFIPERELLT